MNTSRGFATLYIVGAIVALIAIGTVGYAVVSQKGSSVTIDTGGDLIITSPSAGAEFKAGDSVTIRWTIPQSFLDSFPSDFKLGLFLNVVGQSEPGLNAYGINDGTNDPAAGSVTWKIPTDATPGTYHIEAYLSAEPKDFSRMCAVTTNKDCSPSAADIAVMLRASIYKTESGWFAITSAQPAVAIPPMSTYVPMDLNTLSVKNCIANLYVGDRTKYDFWKNLYGVVHPEFRMYDAGSYCELSDGTQLVSFSFFKKNSGEWTGLNANSVGQSIAWFDTDSLLIRETEGLFEQTLGDLGSPRIDAVGGGKVYFSFSSGDAGAFVKQFYELSLSDFTFLKTGKTVN